jgi:hypothetical protein
LRRNFGGMVEKMGYFEREERPGFLGVLWTRKKNKK